MNDLLNAKFVSVIQPTALTDNASWTTAEVDTLGWGYATFVFTYGASDIAMTALKLQESSTSGSGFTDITGLVVGTSTDIEGNATTCQVQPTMARFTSYNATYAHASATSIW